MNDVMIAGVGFTEAMAAHRRVESRAELCREAAHAALDHAGSSRGAVDALVVGQIDGLEPTNVGGRHIAAQLGFGPLPVFFVSCGGATGATLPQVARDLVGAGDYESVLCIGPPTFDGVIDFQKTLNRVFAATDPPLGIGSVHVGAAIASAYQRRYGVTTEDIALVAVKAHDNAAANPYAHLRNRTTVADVLTTPLVASPLHVGMVCPVSSSSAALLVTSAERARKLRNPLVRLRAIESNADTGRLSGRPGLADMQSLAVLARRVFRAAGVTDPRHDIDVLELFAPYAAFELMQYEALGLCPPGAAGQLLRSGATGAGGDIPVNLSGGPLCTNAGVAAELAPFGYVALQLMEQAVGEQATDARRGAAHSMGSSWFMCNTLGVLERVEDRIA
ncbi:thiolase family protein [Antrihabitans stalactiti]|uniref:Thiolase family protein n=1 Tax=Antrihabitans stalactiti TaxID=2584121 RepID=A0A848KC48_9NOCA|nr:thiolase family protein [Antrihabitans stalactiti]NMN95899.1 thiolase family protein [Antrihabitans stalactiti]